MDVLLDVARVVAVLLLIGWAMNAIDGTDRSRDIDG